jgi:hypothetical protein
VSIDELIAVLQKFPKDTICVESSAGTVRAEDAEDSGLWQYDDCTTATFRIITPSSKTARAPLHMKRLTARR